MGCIYALVDPHSNQIRYIGITKRSVFRRLSEHLCHSKRDSFYAATWLRSLKKKGLKPKINILADNVPRELLSIMEQFYINFFSVYGCNLTNTTDGGEKGFTRNHTEESKRKISKALMGNKYTLGYKQSEETIRKRSATIREMCKDRNFVMSHYSYPGEKNGNSKITIEQVNEIKNRYANGDSCRKIAEDYPIQRSMVNYIVNGKFWRDAA